MTATTHNFENIGKLVQEHKLSILDYYPYGPNKTWEYWISGTVDLTKEYKDKRNKGKTEAEYVYNIQSDISKAMHYLTVWGAWNAFDTQRIEVFALAHLFNNGIINWSKDPLVGISIFEQDKLIAYHQDRTDRVYGSGKYSSPIEKKYEADRIKKFTKLEKQEYIKNMKDHAQYKRETYGICEVKYFPLCNNATGKVRYFYTKQELAAIHLMVLCAFENLC